MAPPRATPECVALLGGSELHRDAFASRRERVATTRTRVVGFAAGAVFALLAVAALAAGHGEFHGAVSRGALAALGRGSGTPKASKARGAAKPPDGDGGDWLLGGGPEAPALGKSKKAPKSSAAPRRPPGLHNAEGALPGLVEHVSKKTDTTRFRMITFCNQAYWPFSHGMLQSMQFVAPTLIPFWTVIVADEPTRQFVLKQAPDVDVFVDRDLQDIVASADAADVASLTKLLSWRRMHALHGLIQADFTAVFLEPDVVFTKNPLQLFHDMLVDADVVATSDYGVGAEALPRVNTKVLFAKPSDEAKKLIDVWQRAEGAYKGEDNERGFLVNEILPNADKMEAAIHVLDQNTVSNYLTHHPGGNPTMITGTGCDDVNYKLNWMDQIVRTVLPAGPDGIPPIDYETVQNGCDWTTRTSVQKELGGKRGGKIARISAPRKVGSRKRGARARARGS